MADWKERDLARIREILTGYQARHATTAYDYRSILDMGEAEFRALCQPPQDAAVDSAWAGQET